MSKKRRQYSSRTKFQIALEAAKGQKTISQLASEHSIHPNQIREWKQKLLHDGDQVFSRSNGQREQEKSSLEARQGGIWRFIQRDQAGNEYAFRGVFHECLAPQRIVRTFEFEAMPGHVLLETVVFEEEGGQTKVTASSVFQTQEARDGMLQSGAEHGAAETWDRLDELLAS